MAPFHPLRHDARAFTARAGAALAVFLTIAFVLLAGGTEQQLASAEANKGDTGAGEAAASGQTDAPIADAPATEPVLGAEPPPEAPAAAEGASGPEGAAEGRGEEPTPASKADAGAPPLSDEDGFDGHRDWGGRDKGHGDDDHHDGWSGGDKRGEHDDRGGDDGWGGGDKGHGDDDQHDGRSKGDERGEHDDRGDDDDRRGGDERGEDDDRGDDDRWRSWDKRGEHDDRAWDNERGWVGRPGSDADEGDDGWGSGGRREGVAPPSGGGKGADPGYRGGEDDWNDEPAPSGRPQVTPPAGQEPSSNPAAAVPPPSVQDTPPGSGTGNVDDSGGPGDQPAGGGQQNRRFRTAATGAGQTGADTGGGTGGVVAGDAAGDDTAGTGASGAEPSGDAEGGGQGSGDGASGDNGDEEGSPSDGGEGEQNVVERTVRDIVEVVPDSIKVALAALAALSVLLGTGYLLAALRARRLARQRRELLQEVGLLQTALLPPVPDKVGALLTSVAYRPADGPGAGGDFYDVLPLPGGRVGFILGDVSGHGRGALARTAFMRYTLRAYLEAGLEPRVALQVAGRVIDENLGGDFATVLLAVHDPETGSLTYATAGHPAPIVVGSQPHEPVTAGSSPPIGVGVRTGLRQTTVPLVSGSVAALFTDGLMEARTEHGILGRERLAELLDEIRDDPSARRLIECVAAEAALLSDDMAAVVVTPTAGVTAGLFRTEQLELSARELDGPIARRFLEACGVPAEEVDEAERDARQLADRFGGVVLHVVFGNRLSVEVLPRNVESIEAASRRVSAGTAQ